MFFIHITIYLLVLFVSFNASAQEFSRSLNDKPWALTTVKEPVRSGRYSERFELRAGDCSADPGWSDCEQDRERIEQSQREPLLAHDRTYWAAWSFMLSEDWVDISPVTTTLGQFHHRSSLRPVVLFIQRGGRYLLRLESARELHPHNHTVVLANLEDLKGRWTDVVVEARFSHGPEGVIRVWVNGLLRAEVLGTTTLGDKPIFFKYGIYRSFVSRREVRPTAVAWFDEVRIGPTRESVDPNFNPKLRPKN